ncbi:MAG: ABC transporter ATP-binding protein [Anaerolineales bacterium]|nr:ABC transporter ATP-binding protein [Anaerolineales bacterium]
MIQLEAVSKTFDSLPVLAQIDLSIGERCAIAVVGPSGSGKTTLLRLIAGLETVDEGRILIDGMIASDTNIHLSPRQRKVGFVFQFPTLWPHLTVLQNITFGVNCPSSPEAQERCAEIIATMGLTHLLKRYPHQLSGGEARRVSLARTLVCKPKYLLLDEPLTHLNVELRDNLRRFILEFASQNGCGVVWVTHDLEEAKRVSRRIYRLENGHLIAEEMEACL